MQSLLSQISLVVDAAVDWMMAYMDVIVETPVLLLLCVCVPLCSMAVNLLNRLIRL